MASPSTASVEVPLPRVTIRYCTQCKWMLRAAYFAQELLSTFGPPSPNKDSTKANSCATCAAEDGSCEHSTASLNQGLAGGGAASRATQTTNAAHAAQTAQATQATQTTHATLPASLAEVALQPATGGVFLVELTYAAGKEGTKTVQLWDRKTAGGFPETKELKRRVRDCLDPGRDLGHVDRHGGERTGAGRGKDESQRID